MITEEKIRVYIHYEGNDDYFGRCASQEHKETLSYGDWDAIHDLVQDIILVRRNLTTKEYAEEVNRKIQVNELSEEIVGLLYDKFKNGYKNAGEI